MLWQDNDDELQNYDDGKVVDMVFRLQGKTLPVDYSYTLYQALQLIAPWIADESNIGIHLLLSAEEGNGWAREDNPNEILYLSRRTRLVMRIESQHVPRAQQLVGKTLQLNEHIIEIAAVEKQALSSLNTLYARHVVLEAKDEEEFIEKVVAALSVMNIRCKKILCGKSRLVATPEGPLNTRSLLLADLSREDAISLQQKGLGLFRHLGCGVFVPHKSL